MVGREQPESGLGSLFGTILYLSAFTLSVLDRGSSPGARQKRRPTGFQRMRVPDCGVGRSRAALCSRTSAGPLTCSARSPEPGDRLVVLVLAEWVFHSPAALSIFGFGPGGAPGVAGFVLFSSLLPALTVMGFFDTWYEFRMRFRRAALLRRISQRSADQDD